MPELNFEQKFQVAIAIHRHINKHHFPDSDRADDPVAPVTSAMKEIIDAFITDFDSGEYKEGEHFFVDEYIRKDEDGKVVSKSMTVRLLKESSAEDKDGNKITTGIKGLKHPYIFIDGTGYQRIEQKLGQGSFGVVSRGLDKDGKRVAIKESSKEVDETSFNREIEPAKKMGVLEKSAMLSDHRTVMIMPEIPGKELRGVGLNPLQEIALGFRLFAWRKSKLAAPPELGEVSHDKVISIMKEFSEYCINRPDCAWDGSERTELFVAMQDKDLIRAFFDEYIDNNKLLHDPLPEEKKSEIRKKIGDKFQFWFKKTLSSINIEEQKSRFTPGTKCEIAIGAAKQLNKLHNLGYLYLDAKGENFLLTPEGPRLIDYGTAISIEIAKQEKTSAGTMLYLAPEIADSIYNRNLHGQKIEASEDSYLSAEAPTKASDVYSFGRMLEIDLGFERDDVYGFVGRAVAIEPAERPTFPQMIMAFELYKAIELQDSADPAKIATLLKQETPEQLALIDERLFDILHPAEPMTTAQQLDALNALSEPVGESPLPLAVRKQCIEAMKSECTCRQQDRMAVMFTPAQTPRNRLTVEDLESSVIDKVHSTTIGDAEVDEQYEVDEEAAELDRSSQFKF